MLKMNKHKVNFDELFLELRKCHHAAIEAGACQEIVMTNHLMDHCDIYKKTNNNFFKKIRFALSVVFNFSPAKNVSKNNLLVKSKIQLKIKPTNSEILSKLLAEAIDNSVAKESDTYVELWSEVLYRMSYYKE